MELPTPPWQTTAELAYGEMWVSDGEHLKIKHQPTHQTLMMLDLKSQEAIYWVKDANEVPYYESSAPLRLLLHWWMSSQQKQLLHAAAVGLPNKGILLVGKGGSGKSNTAISCINSELFYAADDYCLLSFENEVRVHSLFATAKLHFEDVERHPYLESTMHVSSENEVQDEKALFFLYPKFKDRMIASFPVKAVFIPKVTNGKIAKLTPVSASKAYLALAPSTIFQMQGDRRRTHEQISTLVHRVPCYELELSTDAKENSAIIQHFLEQISR